MNKNYLYLLAIAVVVFISTMFLMSRGDKKVTEDIVFSPSPTPEISTTPVSTPKPKPKATPTPGITVQENSHDYLALKFDEDGNRRLVLANDCSSIVPSQVAYKNNVQIMLDNSYSENAHTLKIGNKEYSLAAGEWRMEILSSSTLPARLTMFCGFMELGEIELQ